MTEDSIVNGVEGNSASLFITALEKITERGRVNSERQSLRNDHHCAFKCGHVHDIYARGNLALPVVLLTGLSEEFFFHPKKTLMEFFQTLKAKKVPPKMSHVQHYHIHYYPMPFPLLAWTKAPDNYYLDGLYDDALASLGWSDYRYGYTPDPSIIMSSGLQRLSRPDLWDDLWGEEIPGVDDAHDTIDRNSRGILVPINRQLVFHLPLKKSRQRLTEMAMT